MILVVSIRTLIYCEHLSVYSFWSSVGREICYFESIGLEIAVVGLILLAFHRTSLPTFHDAKLRKSLGVLINLGLATWALSDAFTICSLHPWTDCPTNLS
jgi:hypothetical protein